MTKKGIAILAAIIGIGSLALPASAEASGPWGVGIRIGPAAIQFGPGYYYPGNYYRHYGGHYHWHDTSHYDYHPPTVRWHWDHYDYTPGHYHFHHQGHWDHHRGRHHHHH